MTDLEEFEAELNQYQRAPKGFVPKNNEFQKQNNSFQSVMKTQKPGYYQDLFDLIGLGSPYAAAKSFGAGIEEIGHGLAQPIAENFLPTMESSKQKAIEREALLERLSQKHPISSGLGHAAGNIAASFVLPGGSTSKSASLSGKILHGTKQGALLGAESGASRYRNEGESRIMNALESGLYGGLGGAAIPVIGTAFKPLSGIFEHGQRIFGNSNRAAQDIIKGMNPSMAKEALKHFELGRKHGFTLSPGEAAGDAGLLAREAQLGTNPERARQLHGFREAEKEFQGDTAKAFIKEQAPNTKDVMEEVREASKKALKEAKEVRQSSAEKHYKASYGDEITERKLQSLLKNDGTIRKSMVHVLNDPKFERELRGYKPQSVKTLNEVKKFIDGKASQAARSGDMNESRILNDSSKRLRTSIKSASPEYKKALDVFSKHSPNINKLENGIIGKISDMTDEELHKIIPNIFKPKGSSKVLDHVQEVISEKNPKTWRKLVRKSMEESVDVGKASPGQTSAKAFYEKILSKDNTFNMYMRALKNDKDAQSKLADLRKIFSLKKEHPLPPGSAKGESKGITVDIWKSIKDWGLGRYDQAMIDVITSDKWTDALKKAMQKPTVQGKREAVIELLQKASKQVPIRAVAQHEREKK